MKLITEKALETLETDYDCLITSSRYDLELELLFLDETKFLANQAKLKSDGILFTKGFTKRTLKIKQSNLDGKVKMSEERVWLSAKGKVATPTSEMDQQRLSNCVGLLEIYLKAGKISKPEAEDYLAKLSESILPELNERFNGDLLPYKPYYSWEKDLIKEAGIKL